MKDVFGENHNLAKINVKIVIPPLRFFNEYIETTSSDSEANKHQTFTNTIGHIMRNLSDYKSHRYVLINANHKETKQVADDLRSQCCIESDKIKAVDLIIFDHGKPTHSFNRCILGQGKNDFRQSPLVTPALINYLKKEQNSKESDETKS